MTGFRDSVCVFCIAEIIGPYICGEDRMSMKQHFNTATWPKLEEFFLHIFFSPFLKHLFANNLNTLNCAIIQELEKLLKLYNYVSFLSTSYLSQVRNTSFEAPKASKHTNSITFPLYNNYLLLSFPELSIEAFIYTGWVTAWLWSIVSVYSAADGPNKQYSLQTHSWTSHQYQAQECLRGHMLYIPTQPWTWNDHVQEDKEEKKDKERGRGKRGNRQTGSTWQRNDNSRALLVLLNE